MRLGVLFEVPARAVHAAGQDDLVTRCLTQQQIDITLWIILAASAMALVTATFAVAEWTGSHQARDGNRRNVLLAVLAAGLVLFLAARGQFWNIVAVTPALGVGAWASVALRRVPASGTEGHRPRAFVRYGLLAVAAACVLAVAAAAVWVIPVDLCV